MESEKVKEIKKVLEYGIENGKALGFDTKMLGIKAVDILTLINELECENERLKEENGVLSCDLDLLNEKLTNAEIEVSDYQDKMIELNSEIAELEEYIKGNEQDAKAFVNGWHKDLETELKQFAERLIEKKLKNGDRFDIYDIDETLKEFLEK